MADHRLQIVLSGKDATQKAFRTVTGRLKGLTKSVFNMRNAMVGAASAAGMGYFIKRTIDATAEIERNAKMAGVAVESYQELSYAASQHQITQEALTDGLKELSLRTDEFVETGAGSAREAFERLGYTQEELNSKLGDTPALMQDIISRMEGLDKAAQIRIADEIFGGQGGEQFIAMIRGGSDAFRDLRDEAHELGVVIDRDLVEQSVEARNRIDALSKILSVQLNSAIAELAPDIANIAGDMADWVGENKEFLTQDIPGHISGIGDSIGNIKDIYEDLPSGAVGAGGVGLVAWMLFGAKPAAAVATVWAMKSAADALLEPLERYRQEQQRILDENRMFGGGTSTLMPEPEAGAGFLEQMGYDPDEVENFLKNSKKAAGEMNNEIQKLEGNLKDIEKLPLPDWGAPQVPTISPKFDKPDDLPEPFSVEELRRAADIYDQTRTPAERLKTEVIELNELANRGLIDHETYTRALNDAYDNLGDKAEESAEETGKAFNYMEEFSRQTAQNMQNNFSDFFYDSFTGKLDSASDYFESFASSLLRTWADVEAKMLASKIFGEAFMTGESSSMGGVVEKAGNWIAGLFHEGGIVGEDGKSATVSPGVFYGAPRLHNGIRSDEYPAILQRGEGVFTQEQMKALGGKQQAPNLQVNVIDNTSEEKEVSQDQPRFDGEKWVMNVVLDAANRNRGGFRNGMKAALNK